MNKCQTTVLQSAGQKTASKTQQIWAKAHQPNSVFDWLRPKQMFVSVYEGAISLR